MFYRGARNAANAPSLRYRQMSATSQKIANLRERVAKVDAAIDELVGGAQSATVSTAGASQSYTRVDFDKLRAWRRSLLAQIRSLRDGLPVRRRRVFMDFG